MIEIQTFLPFSDFDKVASVLDRQRLCKQRVENLQIMQSLTGLKCTPDEDSPDGLRVVPTGTRGWSKHVVTRMWVGYEYALMDYQHAICENWRARSYRDTCEFKSALILAEAAKQPDKQFEQGMPDWMGDERLHSSHRAALLFKAPDHYTQFGWVEEPIWDYWWPRPLATQK